MKKIIIAVVCLALIAAGWYLLGRKSASGKTGAVAKYGKVRRGDISVVVAATGEVEAEKTVEVKSKASGEIIWFPFDEGSIVKKGDLILKLDPFNEQRSVKQAEADLTSAEARLENSKSNLRIAESNFNNTVLTVTGQHNMAAINFEDASKKLKRQEELYDKKLVSLESVETLRTEFMSVKTKLDQAAADSASLTVEKEKVNIQRNSLKDVESNLLKAKITLEDAQTRLKETNIYAPMSGVVISKDVEEGQIISSGLSAVGGGTLLCTVADLSNMYIAVQIDESDIGKVAEGQSVGIKADAYPDKVFKGLVVTISPKGTKDNNLIVFKVKIKIKEGQFRYLKPGMSADVEILVEKKSDILYVPFDAFREKRGKVGINIKDEEGAQRWVLVKKGVTDGLNTEIITEEDIEGAQVSLGDTAKKTNAGNDRQNNMQRGMGMMGGGPR